MNEVLGAISEYGTTAILIGYLIWRDYRFMSKLEGTISAIQTLITKKESNDV